MIRIPEERYARAEISGYPSLARVSRRLRDDLGLMRVVSWILLAAATSALLLEDRASLAVLLEAQLAFGEAPLEHVDSGFPTAARQGRASVAAA